MEVNTRFGRIDVDPDTILTFPEGMPGFENLKRFKLFHEHDTGAVFLLQSLDDPEVQFSLADPVNFRVHYQMTLSDAETALIELKDTSELRVLVILSRLEQEEGESIHANFLSPLVINVQTRLGLQKPLNQVEGFVTIVAE